MFSPAAVGLAGCSDTRAQPSETAPHDDHADEHDAPETGHSDENEGGAAHTSHEEHDDEDKPDRVHLTLEQRKRLSIEVAEAESGSATAIVTAPATVRFDSDRVARIGPRLSAKVVEVIADLGARVEAGDTVAILDSVELGQAKADYLTAAARYRTRLAAYQRNQKLAGDQIISEAALLESRAAYSQARAEREAARSELELYGMGESAIADISSGKGRPLSRYPLTTPIAGVIQHRDLMPGQSISANETPIQVVDNSHMWVMMEAYESDLERLQTGLPVTLSVRPLPERSFSGTIDWMSQALDEKARTVRIRASVANPDGALRAGMFGSARVTAERGPQYALVPLDALQTIDGQDVVFVPADEDNAFRVVAVTTGAEGDGRVEIRAGLQAGDAVVVAGAFALNSALTAGSRSAAHSH
ncbi:efflux RND transporter periplasmic adaptor subunit [Salinisphaera aquimarina]|uniref:Efflux RND transporter periplasmic adaptor subunit n=1 Tax=Salinisphaera aquimarina TaxID=2094031 RepID=A0ABV7EUS2_9GAMM